MPNDATATLRRHVANYLSSTLLPTALPRKVVNSVVAIRLSNSVCFHSFLNRLTFNLFFACASFMTTARLESKIKVVVG